MCTSYPFGIEGGMWDIGILISDHCLSIHFIKNTYSYNSVFLQETLYSVSPKDKSTHHASEQICLREYNRSN